MIVAVIAAAVILSEFPRIKRAPSRTLLAKRAVARWVTGAQRVRGYDSSEALECLASIVKRPVDGILGMGAYGFVFSSVDLSERKVAVKFIENSRQMTPPKQEFRCMKQLAGISLALMPYSLEVHGKWSLLIMERGHTTLSSELKTVIDPEIARGIGEAAAHLLSNIHDAGYVHGDFHPANIMYNTEGQLRCIDLGMASRPLRGDVYGYGIKYDIIQFLRGLAIDEEERLDHLYDSRILTLRKKSRYSLARKEFLSNRAGEQSIKDVYMAASAPMKKYSLRVHCYDPPQPFSSRGRRERSRVFNVYGEAAHREHAKRTADYNPICLNFK